MAVKTYGPKEIVMIFAGVQISGYADGTFLSVSRENPAFTNGSGADGEGFRAKSEDRTGVIVFTLLQTSTSNDALSILAAADELGGDGVAPVLIKDLRGTSLYTAETAWIEKYSDSEFAREVSEREWTLKTDLLIAHVGSN